MKKILVTGACGQIGSELIIQLSEDFGRENIIATDIKRPTQTITAASRFRYLNVTDAEMIAKTIVDYGVDTIFHMAAILSAKGENNPQLAYRVNMEGLANILEVSLQQKVEKVITPSSIAVFGADAPKEKTPNETPLNPATMYGVTKVAGEKLIQYYYHKFGLDSRSLRYPGIISSETAPGGGTTDYAVDMYIHAVNNKPYACYIDENTPLPFMYMPDAIKSILDLANADSSLLKHRVYNLHAMTLTPAEITKSIQKYIPEFRCNYEPDYRQSIAESWPHSIDDSPAREEWGWKPDFDLDMMTQNMLTKLKNRR